MEDNAKVNRRKVKSSRKLQLWLTSIFIAGFIWNFFVSRYYHSVEFSTYSALIYFSVKWFFLSMWAVAIIFFVRQYVDTRFSLFLTRVEGQLNEMKEGKPKNVLFRLKSFNNWTIRYINDVINNICVPTYKNEELLKEVKEEIDKCIQNKDYKQLKELSLKLNEKWLVTSIVRNKK